MLIQVILAIFIITLLVLVIIFYSLITHKLAAEANTDASLASNQALVTTEVTDLTNKLDDLGNEIKDLVDDVNTATSNSAEPRDRILIGPSTIYSDKNKNLRVAGTSALVLPNGSCFNVGKTQVCDSGVSGEDWTLTSSAGLEFGNEGGVQGKHGQAVRMYSSASRTPVSLGFTDQLGGYRDVMTVSNRDQLGTQNDRSTVAGDLYVTGNINNTQLHTALMNSEQALSKASEALAACNKSVGSTASNGSNL